VAIGSTWQPTYTIAMTAADQTIQTYDRSASELASYFTAIGPRTADIERALAICGGDTAKARVVEIGCGNARDAAEIVRRVGWYEGCDPSRGMLELARVAVPGARFRLANALSYPYPKDIDAVFAFASLLHVDRNDFAAVCMKVQQALRSGGVFYLSLKERPDYEVAIKRDQFGPRTFYFYTPELVIQMAGSGFESVYLGRERMGETKWFSMALQRVVR
jgi:SAM-dependent methyltransferase